MQILITDFNNRAELEKHIENTYGKNFDKKSAVLVGSRADLKNFGLGEGTRIWGVECKILGEKKKLSPKFEKPNRGDTKKFGINIKSKK